MNVMTFGALLLLVGGLINTIPPLYTGLAGVFNGTPIIQIVVGALSLIVAIILLVKNRVFSS